MTRPASVFIVVRLSAAIVALATWFASSSAEAQPPPVSSVPAGRMVEEHLRSMMEANARGGANNQPVPAAQPKAEENKPDAEKKPEDGQEKKPDTDVERPTKPPRVPDPREFAVKLDKAGRVPPFNFIGQPWPDVLQWLASISSCSLDWQQLPNDYVNLTTQRSYKLDEVRNLVNRHLHARGYTILLAEDVLSVFKIEKLDPSLVPRVSEDQLYDQKPYDFVKVSFELPEGMEVDKAKEDVKQVLSPNAKVFPLVTTRRILVIDAVANQRLVSALLNEERAFVDGIDKPRVFPLRYARAEKVVDAIYVLFGMDPQSQPTQMDLQVEQQRLQLMMQVQQQGKDIMSMLKPGAPPIYLAVNRQNNSILANAPPEQMKIIERAVKALDVSASGSAEAPLDSDATTATASTGDGNLRLEKYQLVTMDPSALERALEEIGNLDPRTQLQIDEKSKTLFARATEADHQKIASMRDQLDGTGRQLKVIWLPRRLPADAVAGSIHNLMAGQDEEEKPKRPYWYYDFNQQEEEKPKKGFRVDADVENNRLLLWANDAELAQVQQFLSELTTDAPASGGPRPVRVIEPIGDDETVRLLEQLRAAWPALGDNELIINDQRQPATGEPAAERPTEKAADKPAEDTSADAGRGPTRWHLAQAGVRSQFAELRVGEAQPVAEKVSPTTPSRPAAAGKPPLTVTITADGRLVISSQDNAALDRLENFIDELAPPANRFKMFRLDYAKAVDVYYNLKEYFEEELKADNETMLDWWGIVQDTGPKDEGMRMSKRRTLRLIWDPPSNSILVANASPSQLYEIEQLIKEYDQPASADSTKTRRTDTIKVRYSRASKIATAIKDVYRDLLSSKDKEFDQGERKQQGSSRESVTVIRYSGGGGGEDDVGKKTAPLKVGFEGALSIGADDISNVLLVSAQEEIFDSVVEMIRHLDEEARPHTAVVVHRVSSSIGAKNLQKALNEAMGTPWLGGRPEKPEAEPSAEKKKPEGEQPKAEAEGRGENNQ